MIANLLHDRAENMKRLELDSWGDLKIASPTEFVIDNQVLGIDRDAELQLLKLLQIPSIFYDRNPVDIQKTLLDYHLDKCNKKNFSVYTMHDNIVAFGDIKRPYVPLKQVMESVFNVVPDKQIKTVDFRNNVLDIQLTTPKINISPRVGDIVEGGLSVMYSDVGVIDPLIQMYANRLVCSNGMISRQRKGDAIKIKSSTVEGVIAEIEEKANFLFSRLEEDFLHRFDHLKSISVADPLHMVQKLGKMYRLPKKIQKIADELADSMGTPSDMYEIQNLFTSIANDESVTAQQARLLREMGGGIIQTSPRCPTCGTKA